MSEDVNVDLAKFVSFERLPPEVKHAFQVSRALAAFWEAKMLGNKRWENALDRLRAAFHDVMKVLEPVVGDIPIQLRDEQEWTTESLKKKSDILWKLGLIALRNKTAMLEFHPETVNLEEPPTSDPSLSVRFTNADFPSQK